jgi:hypothetical protein
MQAKAGTSNYRIGIRAQKRVGHASRPFRSIDKEKELKIFKSTFRPNTKSLTACLFGIAALMAGASPAFAQSAPSLGTASNFAVLGGAGVTCTDSTITGAVGSLLTVTLTPTCTINGAIDQGDATATQAYNDFVLAYQQLASISCPTDAAHNLSGDLGGQTLSPGVYCISGVGLLTSQLTLNGPSTGIWIFKAASSITPIGGSVVMAGGGNACNVYWQAGTAVSLDATQFVGNVLAGSAITFTGVGSSLSGRALAKTAVTTTGTSINVNGQCASQPGPGPHACSDRVTGGGYINIGLGKANFGVTAGIRKDAFFGSLTYIDHSTGMKVKGTDVTAYVVVDANTRHIEGTAMIDGVAGTYVVDVSDNGKSGRSDTFAIMLSTGYSASGTLGGGNIKLHKGHCDKPPKGDNGHGDHDGQDHCDNDDNGDQDHSQGDSPFGKGDKK